jgi:hypothetical protein
LVPKVKFFEGCNDSLLSNVDMFPDIMRDVDNVVSIGESFGITGGNNKVDLTGQDGDVAGGN